ncbi:MAG TPA: mechanosensitive ion channel domain-containing protein [Stellaceae bacterium]|nr:mechanosensitive ion channel domain-containing protein [Stellaceae bacterium]
MVLVLLTTGAAAQTPPPANAGGLTADQARAALQVLQNPHERQQLVEAFKAIAAAAPKAEPAPAPAAPAKPAAPKAAPALTPDSLGAALLSQASEWITGVAHHLVLTARAMTDFPALTRSLSHMLREPDARARLANVGSRLALVLGCALALEWAAILALKRPLAAVEGVAARRVLDALPSDARPAEAPAEPEPRRPPRSPWRMRHLRTPLLLRRLPWIAARFGLDLLPVAVFTLVALVLLNTVFGQSIVLRPAVLDAVDAYVVFRVTMTVTRLLVAPASAPLRLIHVRTQTAAYIEVWVRRIAVIIVFGIALSRIAVLLGVNPLAAEGVAKVIGLIAHLCLVVMVLQSRRSVAEVLRAKPGQGGTIAAIRNGTAEIWPWAAILLIVAQWAFWAMAVPNGLARLLHLALATVAVLIVARLIGIIVLGALDRVFRISAEADARYPGLERRANRYYPLLRGAVVAVLWVVTIVALLEAWGIDAWGWLRRDIIGRELLSAVITIGIAAAVAILVWEGANGAIERRLQGKPSASSARLRTLVPVLRSALFVVTVTIVGLTALSEIGVNIAPLLAGAGIVGIAVGFGSQKLVQDVITGLFLLLEDAMQVGDFVTVSGLSGTVENLSIRTIRLRADDGAVHLVPFSSVSSVTNANRGIGNANISVSVALKEKVDQVGEVLNGIAAEMRKEPRFRELMLGDLQLWGVDKVGAAGMTIVGQIACTPTGRWFVLREFNRRLKQRFQELGIELVAPP